MQSSKLFQISFTVLVLIITNFSSIYAVLQNSTTPFLFREYIGAEGNNVTFSDVPINPDVEFHFILSFAVDYKNSSWLLPTPSNGEFIAYWDNENLSPNHVLDIKAKHPNVKVAMSLGGDTIYNQTVNFTANSNDSWISNATSSITNLVNTYHLDGIDIDYEHFSSDPYTFAECIGQLITNLKTNHTISFASIAPYEDELIQEHYTALWNRHGTQFDYVDFQFYAYENTTNVTQFVDYFNDQTSIYYGGKILTSFGTDHSGGLSPSNGFFQACKILRDEGKLYGIFVWSADDSKDADFTWEQNSQQFLLTGETDGIGGTGGGTPTKPSASSAITYNALLMLSGFFLYFTYFV